MNFLLNNSFYENLYCTVVDQMNANITLTGPNFKDLILKRIILEAQRVYKMLQSLFATKETIQLFSV